MLRRLFARLFRRAADPSRFDELFAGPDFDLVVGLVGRIQGPSWKPDHLMQLSEPEATVVRLCRFDGIFGNGGLQYWFECDMPIYGRHTCKAFRTVGLDDAADVLDSAYDLFPTPQDYDDDSRRMHSYGTLRERFEVLENQLWFVHADITERAADYARFHKAAFEHLRHTRSWCSITEKFEDA